MPTSTYKSPPRPRNAPVFFALTPHFWLIWTAVTIYVQIYGPRPPSKVASSEVNLGK